nr:MAG TPA: regulatory protein [Caudoviricetes sp.]
MLVEIAKINHEERTVVSSLDIAETFGKEHRRVLQDIREIGCSEEFRLHNFVQSSYENSQGKQQPMFLVTRDGFVLLAMGYTGELAMRFKEAYIKQFNAMESALRGKLIEREKGIAIRQALTKALQQSTENERMHGHAYSTYTNVIYKVLFGMNAAQLREKYQIKASDNLRDCFTQEELRAIQSMECLVSGLVDCGWEYTAVKDFITKTNAHNLLCA